MQPFLQTIAYISNRLGKGVKALNIKPKTIGNALISNVGSIGINAAFAPIVPCCHEFLLLCIGKN